MITTLIRHRKARMFIIENLSTNDIIATGNEDGTVSVFKNGRKLGTKIIEASRSYYVTVYKLDEDILAIVNYESDIVILDTNLQEILSSNY